MMKHSVFFGFKGSLSLYRLFLFPISVSKLFLYFTSFSLSSWVHSQHCPHPFLDRVSPPVKSFFSTSQPSTPDSFPVTLTTDFLVVTGSSIVLISTHNRLSTRVDTTPLPRRRQVCTGSRKKTGHTHTHTGGTDKVLEEDDSCDPLRPWEPRFRLNFTQFLVPHLTVLGPTLRDSCLTDLFFGWLVDFLVTQTPLGIRSGLCDP